MKFYLKEMKSKMKQFLKTVLLACGLLPTASLAALEPASLFTDHMVLQRDMAVPVWGTSDAGAEVVVQFGNQQKSGRADADGR